MVSRLTSAVVRAILVMVMVAAPSALLPGISPDAKQMAALVALFAGLLTFAEYNAAYPSLVEFRDAPPFNRIRFVMLLATVLSLSLIERGRTYPSAITALVEAVGALIGQAMDFPYSPVRLATLMLDDSATPAQIMQLRTAAGMAYLISLLSLGVFVVLLRAGQWPGRNHAFNVWVNLPTFDPTAGADVVRRLSRDARVNVMLGFLLPFLTPAVVRIASNGFEPMQLASPQTLIWTMTAWAFLPASLFLRGIAMARVAEMIRETRRLNRGNEAARRFQPA